MSDPSVRSIQLGLDTFGDVSVAAGGSLESYAQVIRNVVEQGVLADQVGVDAFGVGEHHRDDYAVSAPEAVLAAIAARTERILLGSAVTVLSSDDPVRVYERFATLDAISNGRAEVTLGRGSFTESFALFGYDLEDYDRLFREKIDLFAYLRTEGLVSWEGMTRAPLVDANIFPKTEGGLPTWVGVGGSPDSAARAANYEFPMMLAFIGGEPSRLAPFVQLFRQTLEIQDSPSLPVGVHSPGFVADTDEEARELLFPHFKRSRDRIGSERGWSPVTREQFLADIEHGALHVGSPETVARKIVSTVRALDVDRFDLKYSHGTLPHANLMHAVELYGTKVVPLVRDMLA